MCLLLKTYIVAIHCQKAIPRFLNVDLLRHAVNVYQTEVFIKEDCGLLWLIFTPTVSCVVTWLFLVWLDWRLAQAHIPPHYSPSGSHAAPRRLSSSRATHIK